MKILLIPKSYLGDTILATPLIANLARRHPQAEIWVLTTAHAAQLLERDTLLSGVIAYERRTRHSGVTGLWRMAQRLRAMGFERAYTVQRSPRTALLLALARIPVRIGFANAPLARLYTQHKVFAAHRHEVVRNLGLLAGNASKTPLDADLDPTLRLVPPTANELDKELRRVVPRAGTYAVLVPGSSWATKMWHWQGYRDVARYLIQRSMPVVLDGAPNHLQLTKNVGQGMPVINLAGRTSVADAMYLIRHAALVVCNDSMALHMASAFKVPCVAIFCATSPANGFGPWQNRAMVVSQESLTCRPCGRHGGKHCPTGTEACIREVDSEMVIHAIQRLLAH